MRSMIVHDTNAILLKLIILWRQRMLTKAIAKNATAPNGDECVLHSVINTPHMAVPRVVPRLAAVRNKPLAKSGASDADADTMY